MSNNPSKLSVRDLSLEEKYLFLRVDFNVPLKEGQVIDDTRIRAACPTIQWACRKRARVVLASHLGRPKGRWKQEFSLRPVANHLGLMVGSEVDFAEDCIGDRAAKRIEALHPGSVLLLENLRFHEGEISNNLDFTGKLSYWSEAYVNDAFGTAHREHASTVGVPQELGKGAAGLLMEKELEYLSRILFDPAHPVVAVLGGAKISDKIEIIENLLDLVDVMLIGGGMAFNFLKVQGLEVGKSLVENDKLELAGKIIKSAMERGVVLKLPKDTVIARDCEAGAETRTVKTEAIPKDWMGLDIGPATVEEFAREFSRAETIIWNGPQGVFEIDEFSQGTLSVARAVAASKAFSIIGGGDSVLAVMKAGVKDQINHISTGGGACLEFLAGNKLPGVEILSDR